jgi:hypothetical protein
MGVARARGCEIAVAEDDLGCVEIWPAAGLAGRIDVCSGPGARLGWPLICGKEAPERTVTLLPGWGNMAIPPPATGLPRVATARAGPMGRVGRGAGVMVAGRVAGLGLRGGMMAGLSWAAVTLGILIWATVGVFVARSTGTDCVCPGDTAEEGVVVDVESDATDEEVERETLIASLLDILEVFNNFNNNFNQYSLVVWSGVWLSEIYFYY